MDMYNRVPFGDFKPPREALRQILKTLAAGRLHHTLLFSGPWGSGKLWAARALARTLNCRAGGGEEGPCDRCKPCRLISEGRFPEYVELFPMGSGYQIKVDHVRKLVSDLSFVVPEGVWRMVLFDEAERMNEEAANALLKSLEEPPDRSLWILITSDPDKLLPTVRSRSSEFRFRSPDCLELAEKLMEERKMAAEEALMISRYTSGNILSSWLTDTAVFKEKREFLLEGLEKLVAGKSQVPALELASGLYERGRRTEKEAPLKRRSEEAARDTFEFYATDADRRAGVEEALKKKNVHLHEYLNILESLFRDVLLMGEGISREVLINFDISARLGRLVESFGRSESAYCIERLERMGEELKVNINPRFALASLFLEIGSVSRPGRERVLPRLS